MIFNNFNVRIIGMAVLITLTSVVFTWSLYQPYMIATSTGLGLLLILETTGMIAHNRKLKKDLNRFLDAVKNQDTSLSFPEEVKDSFMKDLYRGFNEIMTDFSLVRKEKELEHHFFQNTIQHVGIGLLAFNEAGKTLLHNKALMELLSIPHLTNINRLSKQHRDLPDLLYSLKNREESFIKIVANNELKHISLKVSDIKLEDRPVRICSFKDITRERNQSEVEAWQKLIRVLRHEIMNSISPIRIMSGNLMKRVSGDEEKLLARDAQSREIVDDLKEGLRTIRKRSAGLSDFVETYRHLTQIPEPRFTQIRVEELFGQVARLFEKDLLGKNITITRSVVPAQLSLPGDEQMLEQVLINLLKNAVEAIEEKTKTVQDFQKYQGKIKLEAYQEDDHTVLSIIDNGPGIPEDQIDSIFVPFYTTREAGSGIGLSLSRQLVQVHNGSMQIQSQHGEGAVVRVRL
jgi:nitrogen fixation/metabolism regulation signal transduction histidine kinase